MKSLISRVISSQQFRFLLVGGINTLLTTGLFILLVHLGVYYHLALIADYGVGILVGFLANRGWTFSSKSNTTESFVRYLLTYLAMYVCNAALLTLIVEGGWLEPMLGQVVAIAVISIGSFLLQKYWVFAKRSGNH